MAGVGPKRLLLLSRLGIQTVHDILYHLPVRYEDRRTVTPIGDLADKLSHDGVPAVVTGRVGDLRIRPARVRSISVATFDAEDPTGRARVTLFGGPRSFLGLREGARVILYGTPERQENQEKNIVFRSPDWAILKEPPASGADGPSAAIPAEWARLLPVYPAVKGLPSKLLAAIIYSCVTSPGLILTDPLPPEILRKHGFPTLPEAISGVHAPRSLEEIEPSRRRLAYQELYEIQAKVHEAADERKKRKAPSLARGAGAIAELSETLSFSLTPYQLDAISEISRDMG
ncbi:MAG: hypothetical protein LBL73_08340, partial [Synergistaceae bacterium]|nr:hypothetical protein [Synergistaceae bacterium]